MKGLDAEASTTALPKQDKGRSQGIVGGLSWLIAGRISNLSMSIVSTAILSRFLTPAEFGQLVPITIIISLSMAVFDGTFGVGIIRSQHFDEKLVRAALGSCISVAAVVIAVVLAASPAIERFFHFDGLSALIAVASLVILIRAVFVIASAVLQRERRFREISMASTIAAPIGSLVVSVPLAIAGFGAWSLLIGTLCANTVETLIVARKARLPWRVNISLAALKDLGATEGFFALSQLFNWAALSSANLVAGHFLGLSQLGYYSRSWRLLDIAVSATSGPMQRVMVPVFAEAQANAGHARAKFEQALEIAVPFFAIAGALACLHAKAIVYALLGQQWLEAIPLVQILFSALLARCGYKVAESVLIGFGLARSAALRQLAYWAMILVGALLAVRWQSVGIAISTSIAVWLCYAMTMGQAVKLLGSKLSKILMIHARAVLLVAILLVFHLLLSSVLTLSGFWAREIILCLGDGLLLATVVLLFPAWLIGDVLKGSIRRLRRRRS